MDLKRDEHKTNHISYDEFEQKIIEYSLDIGDTVELKINGAIVGSHSTKYVKSFLQIVIQDKGIKKEDTPLNTLLAEKQRIEDAIAKEEST